MPPSAGPGPLTGSCFCGAVRFEIAAVFDCRYCHCTFCRRSTGAPFSVCAVVKPEDFRLAAGELVAERRPNSMGTDHACPSCRTGLYFEFQTSLGPFLSVPIGRLDDPDACPPTFHQWFSKRLRWLHVHDTLPKYGDMRIPHPDARPARPRRSP
jgi:hypothetical protein